MRKHRRTAFITRLLMATGAVLTAMAAPISQARASEGQILSKRKTLCEQLVREELAEFKRLGMPRYPHKTPTSTELGPSCIVAGQQVYYAQMSLEINHRQLAPAQFLDQLGKMSMTGAVMLACMKPEISQKLPVMAVTVSANDRNVRMIRTVPQNGCAQVRHLLPQVPPIALETCEAMAARTPKPVALGNGLSAYEQSCAQGKTKAAMLVNQIKLPFDGQPTQLDAYVNATLNQFIGGICLTPSSALGLGMMDVRHDYHWDGKLVKSHVFTEANCNQARRHKGHAPVEPHRQKATTP